MLKNKGVASSVFWLNQPVKIKDYEIKAIRDFLDDYPNVKLEFLNLQYGQKVEILGGSLRGGEDILIKKKTNKVIAEISSMNFSLRAEISVLNVQKI
jgi:transcription antitermination factor NusG